ncbi:MAG: hypothetical protein H0U69_13780 [Trueperaceae bacterium]|nr:hypothetical protein [Trueperaceae bacterium]
MKPKRLDASQLDRLVRSARFAPVADWLNAYVAKGHPAKEALRQSWMPDDDPWAARAGWNLTAECISRSPDTQSGGRDTWCGCAHAAPTGPYREPCVAHALGSSC